MANLTQLKMLADLDGFLLVDKPAGIAFASVVKAVKRKFNLIKVGHGGSLDAMASGLFVLLLGDANKFVGDVMGADRAYTGTIRFGQKTNTHDIYGDATPETRQEASPLGDATPSSRPLPDAAALAAVLPEFKGDIFQTESRWCSVRREGSAAYEIAETGEHKPFMTHVYRFTPTLRADDPSKADFEIKGSKGLLVKTLANDLGDALGCGACLETLRRTQVGKFTVADAVPFDKILATEMGDFASLVLPLSKALA